MLQRQMGDRPRVYLETVYSKIWANSILWFPSAPHGRKQDTSFSAIPCLKSQKQKEKGKKEEDREWLGVMALILMSALLDPHFSCPVTVEDLITHHGPGSDISSDVSKLAISLYILSACQRAVYSAWPMWSPPWAAHFRDRYLVVQPRNPGTFFHASSIFVAWIC